MYKLLFLYVFLILKSYLLQSQPYTFNPGVNVSHFNSAEMLCNRGGEIEAKIINITESSLGINELNVVFEIKKRNGTPFANNGRVIVDPVRRSRCPGALEAAVFTAVGDVNFNSGITTITCNARFKVPVCGTLDLYIYLVPNTGDIDRVRHYVGPFNVRNNSRLTIAPRINLPFPRTGGSAQLTVESCASWNAADNANWLRVSPARGNRNTQSGERLNLTLDANPTKLPRTAILTINSGSTNRTIQIHQDSGGLACNTAQFITVNSTNSSTATSSNIITSYKADRQLSVPGTGVTLTNVNLTGMTGREKVFKYDHPGGFLSIKLTRAVNGMTVLVLKDCDPLKVVLAGNKTITGRSRLPQGEYQIVIDGKNGASGNFTLRLESGN